MTAEDGTLRAAVIGTSFGCQAHVRALQAAGFEVAALVGRDARRTRARAEAFGVPRAITAYEEALALPGLDAVVVATPPATHRGYVLQALAAGRHVLCEKPMALDSAEAREMLAAAQAAGRVHMLVNQLRFRPEYVALKHAVETGLLGPPRHATWFIDSPIVVDPEAPGVPEWWRAASTGGGWLRNLGTHIFDLIRHTLGEFDAVVASLEPGVDFGVEADLGFNLLFRLKGGLQGVLQGSCATPRPGRAIRVSGARATAELQGETLWLTDLAGSRPLEPPGGYALAPGFAPLPDEQGSSPYHSGHNQIGGRGEYVALARAFRAAIEGRPPGPVAPATFRDGVAHMQVLDAIEAAARTRAWTNVPPPP
jgi:predicted dehydrogenase